MSKTERVNERSRAKNEIELFEIVKVLWNAKLILACVTLSFSVLAAIYSKSLPDIYYSEAILADNQQEASSGLSGLQGQLGGLASLAGISFGGGNQSKTKLALEVLKSRQFTNEFIKEHNLLPHLFALKSWDKSSERLIFDDDVFDFETKKWNTDQIVGNKPFPSMQEAYKRFSEHVLVTLDSETGFIKLGITHLSPHSAKMWVEWLVKDLNQKIRERDITEAEESIVFLEKQLEKTQVADIKAMLFRLIEEQTKKIMIAKVREEYVFKTIDAPIAPEDKLKPKRFLIVIIGTILGFCFGSIGLIILRLSGISK